MKIFFYLFLFFISSLIFLSYHTIIGSDIQLHLNIAFEAFNKGKTPFPPLYYLVVGSVLLFVKKHSILFLMMVFVLSLSVITKIYLSEIFLKKNSDIIFNKKYLYIFLILLFFIQPIHFYGYSIYGMIGKGMISSWHNSTTIFTMPFVILLFIYSIDFYHNPRNNYNLFLLVLFVLCNALAKPSFLFSFIPVYFILFFIKHKFSLYTLKIIGLVSLSFLSVVILHSLIYTQTTTDSVIFSPFSEWLLFSQNIFIDFILGLAFPIVTILVYPKIVSNNFTFIYALFLVIMSYVIYICLAEAGTRAGHGNFGWQILMSKYLLYLISISLLYNIILSAKKLKIKEYFVIFILFLHFLSGLMYFVTLAVDNFSRWLF